MPLLPGIAGVVFAAPFTVFSNLSNKMSGWTSSDTLGCSRLAVALIPVCDVYVSIRCVFLIIFNLFELKVIQRDEKSSKHTHTQTFRRKKHELISEERKKRKKLTRISLILGAWRNFLREIHGKQGRDREISGKSAHFATSGLDRTKYRYFFIACTFLFYLFLFLLCCVTWCVLVLVGWLSSW